MTIWARKSLFTDLMGSEWTVELKEHEDYVLFVLKPISEDSISILNTGKFNRIQKEISACGADESNLEFSSDPRITVKVKRSKLPENYKE